MPVPPKKTGKGFKALSNQWSFATPNPGYKLNNDQTLENMEHSYYEWLKETGFSLAPYSATAAGYFGKIGRGDIAKSPQIAYYNNKP